MTNNETFKSVRGLMVGEQEARIHTLTMGQFRAIQKKFQSDLECWSYFLEYAEIHRDGSYWNVIRPEAKFDLKLHQIINEFMPEGKGRYGRAFFFEVIAGLLKEMKIKYLWEIEVGNENYF